MASNENQSNENQSDENQGGVERELVETSVSITTDMHFDIAMSMLKESYGDKGINGRIEFKFDAGKVECILSVMARKNDKGATHGKSNIQDMLCVSSPEKSSEEDAFNCCVQVLLDPRSTISLQTLASRFLLNNFVRLNKFWGKHPTLIEAIFRCCGTSQGPLLETFMKLACSLASQKTIKHVEVSPGDVLPLVLALTDTSITTSNAAAFTLHQLALRSNTNKLSIAEHLKSLIELLGHRRLSKLVTLILCEVCKSEGILDCAVAFIPDIQAILHVAATTMSVSEESFHYSARVLISETDAFYSNLVAAHFIANNLDHCLQIWHSEPNLTAAIFRCLKNSKGLLLEALMKLVSELASKQIIGDAADLTAPSFLPIIEALQDTNTDVKDAAAYALLRLAKRSEANKIAIGEFVQPLVNLLAPNRVAKLASLILNEICKVSTNLHRLVSCDLIPTIERGAVTQQLARPTSGFPLAVVLFCTSTVGANQVIKHPKYELFIDAVEKHVSESTGDLCLLALEKIWLSFGSVNGKLKAKLRGIASKITKEGIGNTKTAALRLLIKMR